MDNIVPLHQIPSKLEAEKIIKALTKKGKISWSTHCKERMEQRGITTPQIINCLMKGTVTEVLLLEDNMKKYHYTECGLDNIYLLNGFKITKTKSIEEIFIHDIHGLHKVIGLSLITKPGLLIGNEIKFIRTTMDLSQTTLARILGLNYQSILAWEKNKTPISKTADHLLRIIFFSYLKTDGNETIYEKINEIADLDSKLQKTEQEIVEFKEVSDEWRMVA